ncbi:carbohydrate ABC transporter permease [Streptomyces californicus]
MNQLQAVILPGLVSAFGVFFMRQYLVQSLPDELIEAARVDGASTARIFWSIVIPIARPGMAVLGMLTFMTAWNDFFWPIIALSSQEPTVQVALRQLGGGYVNDQSVIMAGTLLGTLPVLLVFGLLGRQIVGGIMQGAVKGSPRGRVLPAPAHPRRPRVLPKAPASRLSPLIPASAR